MKMPAQLQHLAQAYFHQDYDLEFANPDAVLAAFAEGEGLGAVRELASEIDNLLAASSDEAGLADLWAKTLGAAYDPVAHGQTHREWFAHVRDFLPLMQDDDETGSS
jgi:hypothetical protein